MQSLNRIELKGICGTVRTIPMSGTMMARFSLATEYSYNSGDGGICIDTTWFNVAAWEGDKISGINALQKGSNVHVIGRLRCQRYVDADGCDRQSWEVVASELNILED